MITSGIKKQTNVNSYNLTFFLSCCFVSDWADRASFSSATSATPERDLDVQNIRCVRPWYVIVQNITISNFKISIVYALGMQLCKCVKYQLFSPLIKIIIQTNNISEVNCDFLAYVVCHSVKWVPNLWELSQLGKNFLSWPPAVGKKHNRQNNDKTNSLWFAEPRKRNSF